MVLSDQVGGMHMERGHPSVLAFWETLPFDQVLQLFLLAEVPVSQDMLDLLLLFIINQIWGRAREIWSVYRRLMIGQ